MLQKTFRTDVISKKVIKNIGQMAQYYMPDHHEAIVSREQYNAVKAEMARRSALLDRIKNAVSLELLPVQGQAMSISDIEQRLVQSDEQFQRLLAEAIDAEDKEACNAQFAEILAEQTALKKQKEEILQSSVDTDRICTRMKQAEQAIENTAQTITEWNENAVRQIVERVTILSADEILVRIKGGAEIKQRLERK